MNVNQSTYDVSNNQHASKDQCGEPDYLNCDWCGDIWLNKTIDYLKHPNRTQNPFFVYLALTTPHAGDVGDEKEYDVPGFSLLTPLCFFTVIIPCYPWMMFNVSASSHVWSVLAVQRNMAARGARLCDSRVHSG